MISTTISTLIFVPTIIVCSLPLLPFAFLTTTLAIIALGTRALIVYAELATVLLKQLVTPDPPSALSIPDYSLKAQPLYSFSSSGSLTPRRPSSRRTSVSQHSYLQPAVSVSTGPERDFEGVGGWREPGEDLDDDAQWTSMNSRLELPAAAARTGSFTSLSSTLQLREGPAEKVSGSGSSTSSSKTRQHKRSWTSGAIRFDRSTSSRGKWGRPMSRDGGAESGGNGAGSGSGRLSGRISPEDGLAMSSARSKSSADVSMGMNVGRVRGGSYAYERKKSGSSGSVSSTDTVPTMTGVSMEGVKN